MARCEDFPCCGHEAGCCPDYDEAGNQVNMKCTCGATVPLSSRYSICAGCLARMDDEDNRESFRDDDDHEDNQARDLDNGCYEDEDGRESYFPADDYEDDNGAWDY